MRRIVFRAALAATLMSLGFLASSRGAGPIRTSRAQEPLRCDPHATREVQPLVLAEGDSFEVQTTFNYACSGDNRQLVFMLAIENSDQIQPPGGRGRDIIENVRDGLTQFVEEVDFDNGSQGGMILYSSASAVRVDLGPGTRQALLSAVGAFPAPGSPSARGAADAITGATDALLAAQVPDEAMRVLTILDSGAAWGEDEAVMNACSAATAAGIHVAVMALEEAGARLQECANEGSFRESGRMRGEDIPDKLQTLAYGLVHGNQVQTAQVADLLLSGMRYVEGSAVPEPSFVIANEMFWDFLPPPPEEGHVVTYRVSPELVGDELTISNESSVQLTYADGTIGEVPLENPPVCVHRRNRPEDCAGFGVTPTPTATATSDVPPEPTETVTPSPEVTLPPQPESVIYLPSTRKESG